MRIHAFATTRSGSAHYRAFEPFRELERRRHRVTVHRTEQELRSASLNPAATIAEADLVYLSRYASKDSVRLVDALNAAGIPVVWDLDDDLITGAKQIGPAGRPQLALRREMMARADLVTTTNDRLAAMLRREGASCVVTLPNYLTRIAAKTRRRRHTGIVLGWIAWKDHQLDWEQMRLAPTFRALLDEHPQLRVESIGPIDLGLPPARYRRLDAVPFSRLSSAIAEFDIGIAPLVDGVFNRMRSDIKLKEYAIAGVPWLASPVGPYAQMGEREGGRLAADDAWREELHALICDRSARRALSKQGRRWAREHTLSRNVGAWESMFAEAVALAPLRVAA